MEEAYLFSQGWQLGEHVMAALWWFSGLSNKQHHTECRRLAQMPYALGGGWSEVQRTLFLDYLGAGQQ